MKSTSSTLQQDSENIIVLKAERLQLELQMYIFFFVSHRSLWRNFKTGESDDLPTVSFF